MNFVRVGAVFAALGAVALGVVYLRTCQVRLVNHALAHEARVIALRAELWRLDATVARLRAPRAMHDRVSWFDVDLAAPSELPSSEPTIRLAQQPR